MKRVFRMMCFIADGLKKFLRKVVLGNTTPMRLVFPGTFSQFLAVDLQFASIVLRETHSPAAIPYVPFKYI